MRIKAIEARVTNLGPGSCGFMHVGKNLGVRDVKNEDQFFSFDVSREVLEKLRIGQRITVSLETEETT